MDSLSKKFELRVDKLSDFKTEKYKGGIMVTGIVNPDATEAIIPDGVTAISNNAFEGKAMLESITLPCSLKSIGNAAFSSTGLKEITLPDSVVSIGDSVFSFSVNLVKANLGNGLKEMGKKLFLSCQNLKSLILGDSLTSVNDGAFGLHEVEEIVFGKSIKNIPKNIKNLCYRVKKITVHPENKHFKSVDGSLYSADGKTLIYAAPTDLSKPPVISNSVIKIAPYAFDYKHNVIILPEGVKEIEDRAFTRCYDMIELHIPKTLKKIGKVEKNYINQDLFYLTNIFYEGTLEDFKKIKADKVTKELMIERIKTTRILYSSRGYKQ